MRRDRSSAPLEGPVVDLTLGMMSIYKTQRPFKKILSGHEFKKIMDVQPLTDQTVTVVPLARGVANLLFLDDAENVIDDVEVRITELVEPPPPSPLPPPPPPPPRGRLVMVYAKGVSVYRCGPDFCDYHGQRTAPKE